MRRRLKQLVLRIVYHSGAWRLVRRARRRRVVILMYHGVCEGDPGVWTQVPAAKFERQMAFVARRYRAVPLNDAVRALAEKSGEEYLLAVTFDDGFANNARVAAPILRRHRIPATVYLATGFVDGGPGSMIWTDRVYALLRAARERGADLSALGVAAGDGDVARIKEEICGRLKRVDDAKKNAFLERLSALAGPPLEDDVALFAPLDWPTARAMAEEGQIEFGAHTVEHVILSTVDLARAEHEIVASTQRVSERVGRPVRHFAYPNGGPADFDDSIRAIVARHHETAVTTIEDLAAPGDDPFTLRRVAVGSDLSQMEFELHASGTIHWLRRLPGFGHV